ncbi:ThuA domain-containing protein [Pelagicoccus enzymogenes]|uniref:ThuA domain-containing protein n=1 Tax=Pelagicoccus enzymogenes TaxID=2773457 RepID=UPI00280F7306|nr:ThuA domain-containing protein [Pelagicoccus enzymogenes]MDQ8199850.1 ThuA domain-containing protein [Pelagicoccus enzymogenes]
MRLLATFLIVLSSACFGFGEPLRLHLLSGSEEYQSEKSLSVWAERLQELYGVQCTFSLGTDKVDTVDGLEAMDEADVLVVFCRRWILQGEEAQRIVDWCEQGKPVLAIRTGSHAFEFYKEFDSKILGGDYSGHGPAEDGIRIEIVDASRTDPILYQLSSWSRPGKLYRNPNIASDVQVLLTAKSPNEEAPVAWKRINGEQRVFYTSLGVPEDFRNERFLGMLDRALFWVADRK